MKAAPDFTKENPLVTDVADVYWIDKPLIVMVSYNASMDLESAKSHVMEMRNHFSDFNPILTISEFTRVRHAFSVSRDAREYLSSPEVVKDAKASALVFENSIIKMVGTLFVNINKPPMPTKLFTNVDDALDWLKTFI